MPVAERERLWRRLEPLSVDHMPLSEPPRESRFGSPLKLSKVHWVRPEMIEVSYGEWASGRLLRQGQTGNPSAPQPCRLECAAIGDRCKTG